MASDQDEMKLANMINTGIVAGYDGSDGSVYLVKEEVWLDYIKRYHDTFEEWREAAANGGCAVPSNMRTKAAILNRGSAWFKDWFTYSFGEKVLYVTDIIAEYNVATEMLSLKNGGNYVVGSFFIRDSENQKPTTTAPNVRRFSYKRLKDDVTDETPEEERYEEDYIKFDAEDGDLFIKVKGDIVLKGEDIMLN